MTPHRCLLTVFCLVTMAFTWPLQTANSGQTHDISTAWNYYNNGQYSKADALFLKVSSGEGTDLSRDAQLGLAYTRLKSGRTQSSIALLKTLVEKNYKLDETLPALMGALSATGDFSAMAALLPRFSEKERSRWRDVILEGRLRVLFSPGILAEKGPLSMDDIQKSQEALERCVAPDVFFHIAGRLIDQGKTDAGGQILETLLGCDTDLPLRLGILSRLPRAFPLETALTLVNQQIKQHPGLSLYPYAREMKRLKIQFLQSKLNTLPAESNSRMVVIKQLLDLDPGNPAGLTESGWYFYHKHDYDRAILFFQQLMVLEPENMDHVLGRGYSLYQLKRLDEAAALMAADQIKETKKILELKALVYHTLAQDALARGDKAGADMHMGVLEGLFDKTGSPAVAQQLLSLYRDGDTKKGWQLARRLAAEESQPLKSEASSYYYKHNSPILAAQTTDETDRCFTNADSPRIHMATRYRIKDGDEGTSQLDETSFIAQLVFPYPLGYQWSVSFKSNRLSSGSAPPIYSVGSFYRYINGQEQLAPVTTGETVSNLAIGWKKEGPVLWDLLVGTSPMNGPVDVTPVFIVKAEMDKWEFEIHRTSVTESILSFTGLEDPFGNDPWGRVVKSGFEAGKSFDLGSRNWLSIKAGADIFGGDNVWDNSAWHVNAAIGRSLPWNNHFDITYGLYLTGMGFENNTNFFTYGHGGYYSPDFMVSGGPIFRIKTPVCKDFWLDLQLSVGWMTEQTSDSPRYPLGNETMTALTFPNALDEFQGRYEGETNSRLSYSVNFEAWKLLTRHLAIGGNVSMERSSAHSEWQTWIGFELFFDPQNAFWRQRSLAHRPVLYRD
jgi:tetratricopeptide (TPR) repeat protein